MVKKAAHPELGLFEYLNGNLDKKAAQAIEAHLSVCEDCSSVTQLVRALKGAAQEQHFADESRVSTIASHAPGEHPDLSDLASFFYDKAPRTRRSSVAAHLARCTSCGEAIALYARAERAAAKYNPASVAAGTVPPNAWEMIRDWEESNFAKLRPANEVLGQELLTRLAGILNERHERRPERDTSAPQHGGRVPVLIVSSSGEVRSVEFFEKEFDSTGTAVLRHSERSIRFDNKPLLVLLRSGDKDPLVVSNTIRRDTIQMDSVGNEEESLKADYIIIED